MKDPNIMAMNLDEQEIWLVFADVETLSEISFGIEGCFSSSTKADEYIDQQVEKGEDRSMYSKHNLGFLDAALKQGGSA